MTTKSVVVLDYGSGNLRSAQRALERVGADVEVTSDAGAAARADGLVVPGVGAYEACMAGLRDIGGDKIIAERVAAGRPVLGVCVGMQILFARGCRVRCRDPRAAASGRAPSCGWMRRSSRTWAGTSSTPHRAARCSRVWTPTTRFYFVHSYAAQVWEGDADARLTWATHHVPFLAAVEDGALSATQFHPEKSGDAGATLLANWVSDL